LRFDTGDLQSYLEARSIGYPNYQKYENALHRGLEMQDEMSEIAH